MNPAAAAWPAPEARRHGFGLPRPSDPRWPILAFLFSYVLYAVASPGFSRTAAQFAVGLLATVGVDLALILAWQRARFFPMSGVVSSMGLLLLCESPALWPYALVGTLGQLSKHFVRSEGRHVFNPLNFGIVAGSLLFGSELTIVAGRWGGALSGMAAILTLGVFAAKRGGRLALASSYAAGFLAFAAVRAGLSGAPFSFVAGPATGAAFQLFTFFMITDPATTPSSVRGQAAFGLSVAALDAFLRWHQVHHAPFLALFAASAVVPLSARPER